MKVRRTIPAVLLTVSAVFAQTDTLSYGKPADVHMDEARLLEAAKPFRDAVVHNDLAGVVLLVARNRKIVFHEAYGWRDAEKRTPMVKDSLFRMASNSKAPTAAGVLALVDQGKLELDDPVHQYLPSFDNPRGEKITVRMLLTHTSGLRIGPIFLSPLIQKSEEHPDAPSLQLEVARFGEIGAEVEPGQSYSYNNAGYNTLGALIEVVSGKPYKTHLREALYEPLGMDDSLNHEADADHSRMSAIFRAGRDGSWRVGWKPGDEPDYPFPRASGGMISTAYDYAIFCQMFLNGGTYGGARVLSEAMVKEATNPQGDHIPAASGYGLGWAATTEGGVFSHGGSDGTDAWIDPERQIIGLVFTQSPGLPGRGERRREFQRMVTEACTDSR